MANDLPFTRFTHGPAMSRPPKCRRCRNRFESVNDVLAKETADAKENPRHTAPQLKSVAASLYPFVNQGPVDVRGGHHDAGDYSKYTENSANFIHLLVFAADNFPAWAISTISAFRKAAMARAIFCRRQNGKRIFWRKCRMPTAGSIFWFIRASAVMRTMSRPTTAIRKLSFPKRLRVTAAAVAALAQCASSPTFKQQFPEAAALYLEKAKKGWAFLDRAIAKYGKDGAYQKITHYGDDFMHDDELAWAACEMFLATGDPHFIRNC